MEKRIGIGYDSHRFVEGRKLYLGGIEIPYSKGLLAHSDGDVLIHSIIDAILGGLNWGDIGRMFPDSDPTFEDIRSTVLLSKVSEKLKENHIRIINVDSVLILEEPKLLPYVEKIKESVSFILEVSKERVSIKAKTNEGMGFIGRKEGIASISVVLLEIP